MDGVILGAGSFSGAVAEDGLKCNEVIASNV